LTTISASSNQWNVEIPTSSISLLGLLFLCLSDFIMRAWHVLFRAVHPKSGRVLEVFSDQPGVQFYTSNFLPADDSLPGKGKATYKKHGAFCLETQNFPDAVNNVDYLGWTC
jgi:aldose 1-epimerase